ncbi:hypothetical protein MAR_012359 [Mya arenaria]|uniref:Cysteine and tyrosine-rich protein 1 n=1 Tax=Mya arenaria TaxID=6604 RepID=A0ABY7FXC7_MYAAR|nr:hypothetical protein MAR_012359 [Mya arenaria]
MSFYNISRIISGIFLALQLGLADAGWRCNYVTRSGVYMKLYCPYSECCGSYYYYKYCCNVSPVGTIVGGVVGFVVFVAIIASIVSCCMCACCPVYRYRTQRSNGLIITTGANSSAPTNYNTISGQTHTAQPAGGHMVQPNQPPPIE